MSRVVFKMPDLGEGTVEAEIVAWHVKPGDLVKEDQIMAEVMTEKAAVEVPSPVTGRVVSLRGAPGDTVAVGSELVVFETAEGEGSPAAESREPAPEAKPLPAATAPAGESAAAPVAAAAPQPAAAAPAAAPEAPTRRIMASPATRRRAQEAGIDLGAIRGSGPGGRITRADLAVSLNGAGLCGGAAGLRVRRVGVEEIPVIGLRRQIAQRLSQAKREIPHFSYVEEVDVTALETLRSHLNAKQPADAAPLTYLPFIVAALARVLADFPQCNATYDAARGVILRHRPVHVGVATQGPDGLLVPVVRHAESLSLRQVAAEIRRLSEAARARKVSREELSGSTITVTSLGKLGGIVSTPVINSPEVAIIGVNKAVERPVVVNGTIAVRRMMNLSSSFDHRFVDGYDAAAMIQALREMLEHPATIFIQD